MNEGGTATYRVYLSEAPTHDVTVRIFWWVDADDDLAGEMPGQNHQVIDSTNWQSGVVITVSAPEDGDSENGVAVFEHLLSSDDTRYDGIWAAGVRATERDND